MRRLHEDELIARDLNRHPDPMAFAARLVFARGERFQASPGDGVIERVRVCGTLFTVRGVESCVNRGLFISRLESGILVVDGADVSGGDSLDTAMPSFVARALCDAGGSPSCEILLSLRGTRQGGWLWPKLDGDPGWRVPMWGAIRAEHERVLLSEDAAEGVDDGRRGRI